MKRLISAVVILLTMTSCSRLNNEVCSWFRNSHSIENRGLIQVHTDDLSEVIWNHAVKYKYERRLMLDQAYVCIGEDHSKIRLEFTSMAILDVRRARELLVDLVEDLLSYVNESDAAFRLSPFPFTADDLEIYINFESYYGIYIDPYYVGWIVLEKGMAYYYAFDLIRPKRDWWQDHTYECWHSRIEPYFKSLSYVNLRRQAEDIYKLEHTDDRKVLNDLRYIPKRSRREGDFIGSDSGATGSIQFSN